MTDIEEPGLPHKHAVGPGGESAHPPIELEDVHLRYFSPKSETEALQGVTLSVAPREFLAIVGPSGCGKSTVLSLICGLIKPTSGRVLVNGAIVRGPTRKVGYMLQSDYLFEWRTVLENVLIGAQIQGLNRVESRQRAIDLLERYAGLEDFHDHYPDELSGGMRQRVALVRTLATNPDTLLLDEPFSALDFQTRLTLADEIRGILRAEGKSAILVTHDIGEAITMADRVVVLSNRPGRVKSEHRMEWPADMTPLQIRAHPDFPACFNTIWAELDIRDHRRP